MSKAKVCLELARLTGTSETWPCRTWLDKFGKNDQLEEDPVSRLCSLLDAIELERVSARAHGDQYMKKLCLYLDNLELDQKLQSCRFSADHSGTTVPWKMLRCLCQLANLSQSFYRSISREQWLRTVITSPEKPRKILTSKLETPDQTTDSVLIHSNVVPRQAYLTRLQQCTCDGTPAACLGCQCFKGFFPSDGHESSSRKPCGMCPLVEQLKSKETGSGFVKFWFLAETDVKLVTGDHGTLGEGSEGAVSKILWRKGIFARKRFFCEHTFDRELEVVMEMSHPNIVHCFGCSSLQGDSAERDLFMELLEEDLGTHLQELDRSEKPLSFDDLLDVLLQVAKAMRHLHDKHFVHGDLKPGNILLSRLEMPHSDAHYYLVKIADFGCAQRVDSDSGATVKPFLSQIGTREYTAPEVFKCRPKYGGEPEPSFPQKIDVYSFGVVAFQVLTGVPILYDGLGPSKIVKGVVQGSLRPDCDFNCGLLEGERKSLLPFVKRCWAQKPQDRPTFKEICEELVHVVTNDHGLIREKYAKHKRHDNIGTVRSLKALWPGNKGTC